MLSASFLLQAFVALLVVVVVVSVSLPSAGRCDFVCPCWLGDASIEQHPMNNNMSRSQVSQKMKQRNKTARMHGFHNISGGVTVATVL